jgi:hypothetical protein
MSVPNTQRRLHWRRALLATTAALSLGAQNAAFAACSDGKNLPAGGFVVGRDSQVLTAANWSANVFTAPAGSIFVPDNSVNEINDLKQPLTGGGHNWVFDQGSTLCKETDAYVQVIQGGKAPAVATLATAWTIPPNTATDCVVLPVIKGGRFVNLGDIPLQGQAITPTCNPALLAPNPANTYFNQLGCSISHGLSTTAANATTYMFVAGIKGGLFAVHLDNVPPNGPPNTDAGKTNGFADYYSDIPEGQKLTNAAVSPDGMFAMATSIRRAQYIYACLNPLGDPGDPSTAINPNFFVPPAGLVKCMQVGNNNLAVDLTTAFGPDNQPYFGGQRIVNSFNADPGSSVLNPVSNAWPQCITQGVVGMAALKTAFSNHSAGGCHNAQPNSSFASALVTQPSAIISHALPTPVTNPNTPGLLDVGYMYTGPLGGTVDQFKVSIDPISGLTHYAFRTYLTGISLTSGLGIADDLKSLMVFTDPSTVGLAGQGVVTKLPLCEDM